MDSEIKDQKVSLPNISPILGSGKRADEMSNENMNIKELAPVSGPGSTSVDTFGMDGPSDYHHAIGMFYHFPRKFPGSVSKEPLLGRCRRCIRPHVLTLTLSPDEDVWGGRGRGRLERFARARPLFKDDPEKYIGMNPMDACRELDITLVELIDYINAEEDIFPNPRFKLLSEEKIVRRNDSHRKAIMARAPPAFKFGGNSPGGVGLGRKIGQKIGVPEVSDPAVTILLVSWVFGSHLQLHFTFPQHPNATSQPLPDHPPSLLLLLLT